MVRRVNPAQLKSLQRQAFNKYKQAVDQYNREVRRRNQNVKQQAQKINQAIGQYNRDVRAYNLRVRSNRQLVLNELAKLNRQSHQPRFSELRTSVNTLSITYGQLEQRAETQLLGAEYNQALDFSEQETANSLQVMNSLLDSEKELLDQSGGAFQGSGLTDELSSISSDLDARWRGAVFSLNPANPDAARHFCTSAREVITGRI
jgi:hypothetical protein